MGPGMVSVARRMYVSSPPLLLTIVCSSCPDYEAAARWTHSECRNFRNDNFTYADFEAVYKSITSGTYVPSRGEGTVSVSVEPKANAAFSFLVLTGGLDFFSIDWIPNITHAERAEVERVEGAFWKTIEGGENYQGFTGQEPDPDNPGELIYANRTEQPFYFPIYVSRH